MSPMLETRNLTKSFGGVKANDGVNLTVQHGEILGVIGPNGAGKTTLFNLICGVERPTSGQILFEGHVVDGAPVHRLARMGLGRTFQNLRVFSSMSVYENALVGAIGKSQPQIIQVAWADQAGRHEEHVRSVLRLLGMCEIADQPAGRLSYGERKMLEIARALAGKPSLLLLDEPAAGLNSAETAKLAALIRHLCEQRVTVMLVEHDMKLVMGVCDRVAVLAFGKLLACDEPSRVQVNPRVIEAYLGTEGG